MVQGSVLRCTYSPEPTGSGTVDWNKAAVIFEPSNNGGLESMERVPNAGPCVDGAYYLEDEDTLSLCPAACDRVRMDEAGKLTLRIGRLIVVTSALSVWP